MPQFDIYHMPRRRGAYVVDVQADRLDHFARRVVIPLFPADDVPGEIPRLTPGVEIGDRRFVLATHLLATVPVSALGQPVGSLAHFQDQISIALEVLLKGFP